MLSRVRILVFIFLGAFLVAADVIVATGLNDHVANADMIVVPGNTVATDGTPSPRLQARLDAALEVYREGRAPLIFVSGGTGKEGYDEALSMSEYLIRNGVPPAAIVNDSSGIDTAATARNAGVFMKSRNLKSAIIATQYFHVARTRLALERNGVQVAGSVHAHYFEARDLYSIVRETIAYVAYAAAE